MLVIMGDKGSEHREPQAVLLTTRSKASGMAERPKKAKERPAKVCLLLGTCSSCCTPPASTSSSANLHAQASEEFASMHRPE